MTGRYELKDSHHPDWRGSRYTGLDHARRVLAQSQPPGRFYLVDRKTKERVS